MKGSVLRVFSHMMARGRSVGDWESIRVRTERRSRSHCRYSLSHSALRRPRAVVGTSGTRNPRVSMNRSPLMRIAVMQNNEEEEVWNAQNKGGY